jgi:hypothetical protein
MLTWSRPIILCGPAPVRTREIALRNPYLLPTLISDGGLQEVLATLVDT